VHAREASVASRFQPDSQKRDCSRTGGASSIERSSSILLEQQPRGCSERKRRLYYKEHHRTAPLSPLWRGGVGVYLMMKNPPEPQKGPGRSSNRKVGTEDEGLTSRVVGTLRRALPEGRENTRRGTLRIGRSARKERGGILFQRSIKE